MSASFIMSRIAARARSFDHSFSRRLVSKETRRPAAFAAWAAAWQASQAEAEMARLMPDRCTTRARVAMSAGRSAGQKQLAAEPVRKNVKWWRPSAWVTK